MAQTAAGGLRKNKKLRFWNQLRKVFVYLYVAEMTDK